MDSPHYDDEEYGLALAAYVALWGIAAASLILGVFIGWLIFAPPANAIPTPCAELRSECAAVMEAR